MRKCRQWVPILSITSNSTIQEKNYRPSFDATIRRATAAKHDMLGLRDIYLMPLRKQSKFGIGTEAHYISTESILLRHFVFRLHVIQRPCWRRKASLTSSFSATHLRPRRFEIQNSGDPRENGDVRDVERKGVADAAARHVQEISDRPVRDAVVGIAESATR